MVSLVEKFTCVSVNRDANSEYVGGGTVVSHVFILWPSSNLTARGERSTVRSWFRMSCLSVKCDWAFHLSIIHNWNELWQVGGFVRVKMAGRGEMVKINELLRWVLIYWTVTLSSRCLSFIQNLWDLSLRGWKFLSWGRYSGPKSDSPNCGWMFLEAEGWIQLIQMSNI